MPERKEDEVVDDTQDVNAWLWVLAKDLADLDNVVTQSLKGDFTSHY